MMRRTLVAATLATALGLGAGANAAPVRICMVFHDTASAFSETVKAGAMAAAKEFGVSLQYLGPAGNKIDEQAADIENCIAQHVDGIATTNINGDALNPLIRKAIDAGIPTVTFNSDSPDSPTMAFYGQDLPKSGVTQGEILVRIMGKQGKVLAIAGDMAAAYAQDRNNGVKKALSAYPGIQIVQELSPGFEEQSEYAAIENAIRAHPDLTGIVTYDSLTTPMTGRVLGRLKTAGSLKHTIVHVGQDLNPETLDNVKAGFTQATLTQTPYLQGYRPVKALYELVVHKTKPVSMESGAEEINSSNIDIWLKKLKDGEPIG